MACVWAVIVTEVGNAKEPADYCCSEQCTEADVLGWFPDPVENMTDCFGYFLFVRIGIDLLDWILKINGWLVHLRAAYSISGLFWQVDFGSWCVRCATHWLRNIRILCSRNRRGRQGRRTEIHDRQNVRFAPGTQRTAVCAQRDGLSVRTKADHAGLNDLLARHNSARIAAALNDCAL